MCDDNLRPASISKRRRPRFRVLITAASTCILSSSPATTSALKSPAMAAFISPGRVMRQVGREVVRCRSAAASFRLLSSTPAPYNIGNATADSTASSGSTTSSTAENNGRKNWEEAFSVDVPEGLCVGLRLKLPPSPSNPTPLSSHNIEECSDHWAQQLLHPKEVQYGMDIQSEVNRNSFFIGRLAMRYALMTASSCYDGGIPEMIIAKELCDLPFHSFEGNILPRVSMDDPCILKDEYGRPMVPTGFIGSISHKDNIGVALVAEDDVLGNSNEIVKGVGIDIEKATARKKSIERRILTPNEQANLGHIEGISRDEEVLLRFSLKESVYKAMHPLINHYVGFQEAEITPNADGTASVWLNLRSGLHKNFGEIKAHWRTVLDGEYFLSSSSVTLKRNDER
mmetsp:Transcript_28274/g.62980  ORF Transcript_28274/g.62980 Transcript_28274/m.62980 type:complete len:399 (-) Transcript_28274:1726-2922(-)